MQGSAGGVNVYNWRGVWLQRARRKEVLNFNPTAAQEVVISNFTDLSKLLKIFRKAFKICNLQPPTGQTAYSYMAKYNYARQKTAGYQPATGKITWNVYDVQLGSGGLGSFYSSVSAGRDNQVSLTWDTPTAQSPLLGGKLCVLMINVSSACAPLGGSVIYTADLDAGAATFSYTPLTTADTKYVELYAVAYTADGTSATLCEEVYQAE